LRRGELNPMDGPSAYYNISLQKFRLRLVISYSNCDLEHDSKSIYGLHFVSFCFLVCRSRSSSEFGIFQSCTIIMFYYFLRRLADGSSVEGSAAFLDGVACGTTAAAERTLG